jgi:hypothetical protein
MAAKITVDEIEKVLVKHKAGWLGTRNIGHGEIELISTARCACGWKIENGKRFNATAAHRAHVAAALKELFDKEQR